MTLRSCCLVLLASIFVSMLSCMSVQSALCSNKGNQYIFKRARCLATHRTIFFRPGPRVLILQRAERTTQKPSPLSHPCFDIDTLSRRRIARLERVFPSPIALSQVVRMKCDSSIDPRDPFRAKPV